VSGDVVFLTGATGFIGSRVARGLAASGARLRCLVRTPGSRAARSLEELGAELIPGDVNDPAALERGVRGAAVAYHIAAIYDIGVVDEAALEATNVDGTRAFMRATREAGTPRVIHVSSTVALGPVPPDGIGDDQPPYGGPYPSIYHRTKTEAHRIALAAQQSGAPVVIACPAYVYGPGDEGPAGNLIEDLLRRRVPTLIADPAWYSFVHVDDVSDALTVLATQGTSSGVYVLGGENERFDRFVKRVAELGKVFAPRAITPAPLARGIGRALDAVGRRTGIRFPLSLEGVNVVTAGRYTFGHACAAAELGFSPRPLATGLPETVAFFRAKLARNRRSPGR